MSETTLLTLYRWSSIGLSLTDTLDDLIEQRRMQSQLARKIQINFDQAMSAMLQSPVGASARFTGHLDTYRFCDDVWTFLIRGMVWKMDADVIQADRVKIVCCKSPNATV